MIQKIMLEVESQKPLPQYGDRHIIVYDAAKQNYYVTTRESFLKQQNDDIKNMSDRLDKEIQDMQAFKAEMKAEFAKFLTNYKDTNSKIIEMVKSFTSKGE